MDSMIAAILESGRPERLYTGLSLLVSAAADGTPARGLVTFRALEPLLDTELQAWILRSKALPGAPGEERQAFARTLSELRDTALALAECRLWACSAALSAAGVERADAEARLHGVMSTPRFLREVAGAQLVVV
jgi:peroxiredoxin family protein